MKDSPILKYLNSHITNREIIDLWLNAEYFHSDSKKIDRLNAINKNTGISASKNQLFIALVSCSAWIETFFMTINKTNNSHLFIYTPEDDFSIKKQIIS